MSDQRISDESHKALQNNTSNWASFIRHALWIGKSCVSFGHGTKIYGMLFVWHVGFFDSIRHYVAYCAYRSHDV